MQKMNMHIKKGKKKKLNKFLYRFYYYVEPKISPSVHPNYAQQLAAAQLGTRVMQGVAQLILSHSSTKTTTAPSFEVGAIRGRASSRSSNAPLILHSPTEVLVKSLVKTTHNI
eukprot:PhM_4_TR9518/c2_g1_i2/m.98155